MEKNFGYFPDNFRFQEKFLFFIVNLPLNGRITIKNAGAERGKAG
jgi:hypothetical protein